LDALLDPTLSRGGRLHPIPRTILHKMMLQSDTGLIDAVSAKLLSLRWPARDRTERMIRDEKHRMKLIPNSFGVIEVVRRLN
jgi:hypothetical protein